MHPCACGVVLGLSATPAPAARYVLPAAGGVLSAAAPAAPAAGVVLPMSAGLQYRLLVLNLAKPAVL